MKLLSTAEVKSSKQKQQDALIIRGARLSSLVEKEQKKYNQTVDNIAKQTEKLEQDFLLFCNDINTKRSELKSEVNQLENRRTAALEPIVEETRVLQMKKRLLEDDLIAFEQEKANFELEKGIFNSFKQAFEQEKQVLETQKSSLLTQKNNLELSILKFNSEVDEFNRYKKQELAVIKNSISLLQEQEKTAKIALAQVEAQKVIVEERTKQLEILREDAERKIARSKYVKS